MSINAIRAKLLPKFLTTTRDRVIRARAAIDADMPDKIREEMHSITGDAGMIGQPEVAELARACSAHARAWGGGEATARASCAASLDALSARLDAIVSPG